MNLHRAQKLPDWKLEPPESLNYFQKIAEATNGILTPGNLVTSVGLYLVYKGAQDLNNDKILSGTLKIGFGRLMDYFDGLLAHITRTKSFVGEAFDATTDKTTLVLVGSPLYKKNLIPRNKLDLVFAQNAINVAYTMKAKNEGKEIHPSKYGKLATAAQWIFIGSSLLEKAAKDANFHTTGNILDKISNVSFLSFLGLGSIASAKIIQDSNK